MIIEARECQGVNHIKCRLAGLGFSDYQIYFISNLESADLRNEELPTHSGRVRHFASTPVSPPLPRPDYH